MYKSDSTVILPECTHDRMFYKFIGWMDSVTKEVKQPGDEYIMPAMNANQTRTLEAKWDAIEYTIEFKIPGFAEPVTKTFTYEHMTTGADGKQYNLTYAMMQLNEGAFIFNGWFANDVEISAVTTAVLSELYAKGETVYSIDVNIEAVTGYDFERVGSGYAIVSYYGVNDAKLPTHYNGLTVTEISYGAFDSCAITSVTFASKNNITEIGYNAFNGCVNLKSIVIPEEVIKIDRYAFRGCDSEFKIYLEATEIPVGFANYWNADGKGGSYNVYVSEEE